MYYVLYCFKKPNSQKFQKYSDLSKVKILSFENLLLNLNSVHF